MFREEQVLLVVREEVCSCASVASAVKGRMFRTGSQKLGLDWVDVQVSKGRVDGHFLSSSRAHRVHLLVYVLVQRLNFMMAVASTP